jgi:cytochrome c oxidase assembly protein Cox11
MLKKLLFGSIIALFCITLLPIPSLANYSAVQPGTVVKASNDSVYYYGADGKRYVFRTEKVYKTWFVTFEIVVPISDQLLADMPIGGNVTYKPGVKLVKITTDPKVYYVDLNRSLRWVSSESLAKELWGTYWYRLIDDVADTSLLDYNKGEPLENPDLTPVPVNYSINQDKTISTQPDPTTSEISKISLSGSVSGSMANLNWTTTNVTADSGFKVVWSNNPDPVYPGNEYHYLSDANARSDSWEGLSSGTYYFRGCQYLGGKCGIYSNNLLLKIGTGTTTTTNKSISATSAVVDNDVKIKWSANFTSSSGFKIVKAEHSNPVYPGDEYHYLSSSSSTVDPWYDLPAGTWHFRVCEYLGGKCGVYSNDLTVTIAGSTTTSNKTITAASVISGNDVKIKWTANFTSTSGFKIVKAEHVNPVYPGDEYHYLSSSSATYDLWSDLSAGTYHFRVCEYLGGSCGIYSNDVTVTIAGSVIDNSNGTISLSGNVNSGIVYLNWVLSDMTSAQGFKVVYSETANPVYPGNTYHYLSDPNVRTDSWEGLSAGTYHFRVCEYLGGSCGKYSNDLVLTVQ